MIRFSLSNNLTVSQKSDEPSRAGRIDSIALVSDVLGMTLRVAISCWLKVLSRLAFVLALVCSPPSAAHAGSGMHDGHQAKADGFLGAIAPHHDKSDAHDAHANHKAVSEISTTVSNKDDEEQHSNECCNGICISVVFLDDSKARPEPVAAREYVFLEEQRDSVETTGFLRPPRILI